jgi:hypothetical protein
MNQPVMDMLFVFDQDTLVRRPFETWSWNEDVLSFMARANIPEGARLVREVWICFGGRPLKRLCGEVRTTADAKAVGFNGTWQFTDFVVNAIKEIKQ